MKNEITLDEIRADLVAAYPRIAEPNGQIWLQKIEKEMPDLFEKIQTWYGHKTSSFSVMISEMRKKGLLPGWGAKKNGSSLVVAQQKTVVGNGENNRAEMVERRTRMMLDAYAAVGRGQKIKWAELKQVNHSLYQQIFDEYSGNTGYMRAAAGRFRKDGLFKKPGLPHTNGHAEHAPLNLAAKTVPSASPGYAMNRCPNCGMNMEGLSKAMQVLSKLGPEKINALLAGLQNLEQ
jgi:hypothetical protein